MVFSINTPVVVSPYHHSLITSEMENCDLSDNGVNETRTFGNGLSPGRCSMETQRGPGRHQTTATSRTGRRKWTQHDDRTVIECYYLSEPGKKGYRKRMHIIWNQQEMFSVTEQRLVDQANQIRKRKWLSNLELEEINRNIPDAAYGQMTEDTSNREKNDVNPTVNPDILDSEEEAGPRNVEQGGEQTPEDEETEERFVRIREGQTLSAEEYDIVNRISEKIGTKRQRLPSLKGTNRARLNEIVHKVDSVIGKITSESITDTDDIIYGGAAVATEMIGIKAGKKSNNKESWWRRLLEQRAKELSRDLGRMNSLIEKNTLKERITGRLQLKYKIKQKGLKIVREEIKQKIKQIVQKLRGTITE